MTYFRNFPIISYKFGDETTSDRFRNIAIYSDVVDQIKNVASSYVDYYVLPNERPDQVSYKLYGSTSYHWTFELMNPKIRERGWPLSQQKIYEKGLADYNELVLTTRTKLTDKFKVGQTISGNASGHNGTIIHRELDLGQLYVANNTGTFNAEETIQSTNSAGDIETITLTSTSSKYNVAHHYENSDNEWVDIDPETGPGAGITEITWLDRLNSQNDELRQIRIVKRNLIHQISESFSQSLSM